MLGLVDSLKKLIRPSPVIIDNLLFRLHYKATVVLLLFFSVVLTSYQFFGTPIQCFGPEEVPGKVLDNFCWIHGTFSLPAAWKKKVGVEIPYPGVSKYSVTNGERTYHMYYQWVCFVLYLQAIMFFFPRYAWKSWEGGRVKSILLDLNMPIIAEEDKRARMLKLVTYFKANINNHGKYALLYMLSEMLNLVVVIGNIYLTDCFLGGRFLYYGWRVMSFTEWDDDTGASYNPMVEVFPRVTKCTFHMYGSSGGVMRLDSLCLLPANIINEKIYIILWFWFVILSVITALGVIYHCLIFTTPDFRFVILKAKALLTPSKPLKAVTRKCDISDWFLLHLLTKNMESSHFRDFILELANQMAIGNNGEIDRYING